MHRFDEKILIDELDQLPNHGKIAFAAAAATRQLENYERFDRTPQSHVRPREIVTELWTSIKFSAAENFIWSKNLEEVMTLLPENNTDWVGCALAEDAISSLAYAIRCLLVPQSQEAAWAARRAYEAADQAAIRLTDMQSAVSNSNLLIASHEVVQRELSRQKNDLLLLKFNSIEEVERLSFYNHMLSEVEARSLK